MWQDIVNGLFEISAGLFLMINCRRLYKDKVSRGVSIIPTTFFAVWGFWNLYFYPHFGAWLSFLGGILVVTVNTVWVAMMFYYARIHESRDQEEMG